MIKTIEFADFEDAIEAKDYIKIKNYIINSIRNNPGFHYTKNEASCSEAAEAFRMVKERKNELQGLFTPYCVQAGEEEFNEADKSKWDKEYFIRQTFLLEENFCSERFAHVKKIGQYISKNENFPEPQEVMEGNENSLANNEKHDGNMSWVMIAGVVIIVILLVVLIVKKI